MNCSNYASSSPGLFVIKQFKSLIFIILIALSINSAVYGAIPASERSALIALYNSTNGDGWTNNSGWKAVPVDADGFAMPGTENTWHGITVTDDSVYNIDLSQNNLTGTIPPELSNLTNLQRLSLNSNKLTGTIPLELCGLPNLITLDIASNQLTGTIPPEMGNLTNLEALSLSGNELTGTIPHELGALNKLVFLLLAFNQLNGSIPPELGNLTNLEILFLASNELTGTIPLELCGIPNLKFLSIDYNQLTGNVPHELEALQNLTMLGLSGNQFTGTIPPELGNLISLESLSISYNQLTGTVPAELCNLSNLKSLYLNSNKLTGTIPPEIGNLTNLTRLNLSYNELTGSIPPELEYLTNLNELNLWNNQLTGMIPQGLGNLTNLKYLDLSSNKLTGSIPAMLSNLTNLESLSLSINELTGSIPATLGNLTNLKYLYLIGNKLTGSIPATLGNLINLESLFLSGTELTGSIPETLGNLTNLKYLYLSSNELTGPIPETLGNLTHLGVLSLSFNKLTGNLPLEIGNMTNLTRLDLAYNELTGTIPSDLGNLINLTELYLCENQLTGAIPSELGNLVNLIELNLYNNQLSGPIPPGLGNLINLTELNLYNNQITGPIPSALGNLINLDKLNLYENQLTGAIPSELGNLVNLTELKLNNNQLTGTIPSELGDLINLKNLLLHSNHLTGTVPPELHNLPNLELLTVNDNRFTNPPNGTVALIIDAELSVQIRSELEQFKSDLKNEGYTVVENVVNNVTPPEIRSYLQELYIQTDEVLEGAILIGDIPYAYQFYTVAYDTALKDREVISYQYYSDLDGSFETSSGYVSPGKKEYSFDLHNGDLDWEIWVGVLPYYKGNLTDTVSALKRYFEKNHKYRTCGYDLPEAFLQIHEGYKIESMEEHNKIIEQRTNGYAAWTPFTNEQTTLLYFDSPLAGLSIAQGYEDLSEGLADITYTNVHGGVTNNGQIMNSTWMQNNPVKTAFFFTTGCDGGNLDYADNILTSILYSPSSMVVLAQGDTYIATALYGNAEGSFGHNVATAIDSGKNIGRSFLTHVNVPTLEPNSDPAYWEYQHAPRIILGDPTLTRLTDCEPPPNNNGGNGGNSNGGNSGESSGGGGGGGSGIFGNISSHELIGYHMDWIGSDGKRVYMPVTNWIKALKGAQTHVEGFAPGLANFIRGCFDKLEVRANKNHEGLLYRTGTSILPLLGKFAETYLDIFDSRELMDKAYMKTTIDIKKFDRLLKQGKAVSSHKVDGKNNLTFSLLTDFVKHKSIIAGFLSRQIWE